MENIILISKKIKVKKKKRALSKAFKFLKRIFFFFSDIFVVILLSKYSAILNIFKKLDVVKSSNICIFVTWTRA